MEKLKENKKKKTLDLIEVEIRSGYGNRLKGKKVFFEGYKDSLISDEFGTRPKFVKKTGAFQLGKNILESLEKNVKKYRLVVTKTQKSAARKRRGILAVYLSSADYAKLKSAAIEESADVKNDIIRKTFSTLYPKHFKEDSIGFYRSGTIERLVPEDCKVSLSLGDKARVRGLYSRAILGGLSSRAVSYDEIAREKVIFELSTLEAYADALEKKIKATRDETEWQKYIREHILNLKEEYIAKEEKINISIGRTSLPDFLLITQDGFLDVMEIKTPFTPLVSYDKNHDNYFLSSDVMKAVAQTEKYLDQVTTHGLEIEKHITRKLKLTFGVIRPGGLIIAGSEKAFYDQKDPQRAQEDFRRLRNSLKNVKIITYTEILVGLRNRITILKQLKKKPPKKRT